MSEIKGQLLGMILVLALFAAVAGAMIGIFNQSTDKVAERVDQETSFVSRKS
jgi:Na+-translocating ferredoxin:NAD+ oxidoreductase RnfG subunit